MSEPIGWMNGITGYITMNPRYLKQQREQSMAEPEPAQKHDGKLGTCTVEHSTGRSNGQFHYVRIQGPHNLGDDEISISPDEALSLLSWLKQEEAELQRLAKEQEK